MKTAAQIMKNKYHIKAEMDARMAKSESDALWSEAERKLDEIMTAYAEIPKGEHTETSPAWNSGEPGRLEQEQTAVIFI